MPDDNTIMSTIESRLQAVHRRIEAAAAAAGRDPAQIRLLAVSKTFPPAAVRAAFAAGQRAFGENYAQEAVAKILALADLPLEWHFIGPLQSNKTRPIAEHCHWVHSVDRIKIAQRLNDARPPHLPPLEVCVQVNVSGEASKSGLAPAEVADVIAALAPLPRLRIRGLMTLPRPTSDPAEQRTQFRLLRELRDAVSVNGVVLDTLSMGMSDDLESAIAEGATMVRVGRAIFGERG